MLNDRVDEMRRDNDHARRTHSPIDTGSAVSGLFSLLVWFMLPAFDTSPSARVKRRKSAATKGGLLLHWPAREGTQAEVLWVGALGPDHGEALWRYLRAFMHGGLDAVRAPGPDQWAVKGRDPQAGIWTRWAERLCSWPVFPPPWGSDSGQARREDGRGPEQPQRWVPPKA